MPGRLGGQLVDGGDPVADEPVFVVDTGPADESNWSIVATDRSAADGSWSVTVPNTDPKRYHAVAQFEESGTLKNALSKPFLTSQPFAQPGAVNIGFNVLDPTLIGMPGNLVSIGGRDSDFDNVNDVYEYDPSADSWTSVAVFPDALSFHAAASVDGKVYSIGGQDGDDNVNDVYEYDPSADSWTSVAVLPDALQAHAAASFNE